MISFLPIWLSSISTLLAIYAAVITWKERHRKIELSYNWAYKISNQFNVSFNFFNPSTHNVSISKITIMNDGSSYSSCREPILLLGEKSNGVFSTRFPLNISPSTGIDAVCAFQFLANAMKLGKYTIIFRVNNTDIIQIIDISRNKLTDQQFVNRFQDKI